MRRTTTLLLVASLLLAGCSGGGGGPTQTPAATATPAPSPAKTGTSTPTLTETSSTTPTADNPWGEAVVEVYIDDPSDRNHRENVREALDWWEANGARHTEYSDLEFVLVEKRYESDVVVAFVDEIFCGPKTPDNTAGCAPLPPFDETPMEIQVATGYTDESVVSIAKHEFGHALGLEHATSGLAFMRPANDLSTLPQVDARNRTNPWEQSTIRIYVDRAAVPAGLYETVDTQMDHVLTYFNDGGEGATPPNVTLVRTDSRDRADVVVEVVREDDIEGRDRYVTGHVSGTNPDTDEPLETVTNATIRVAYNVGTEDGYIGWATGYYVAVSLEASADDLPPPWSDDGITYEYEWWTRAEN